MHVTCPTVPRDDSTIQSSSNYFQIKQLYHCTASKDKTVGIIGCDSIDDSFPLKPSQVPFCLHICANVSDTFYITPSNESVEDIFTDIQPPLFNAVIFFNSFRRRLLSDFSFRERHQSSPFAAANLYVP